MSKDHDEWSDFTDESAQIQRNTQYAIRQRLNTVCLPSLEGRHIV